MKVLIVDNGIPIFWITINLVDLQCPLIICFVDVELELSNKIQTVFWYKTAIMNPITIAKLFYIIYDAIFIFLFGASQTKKEFLGLLSSYFNTVKTNGYEMLYLHYLIWLQGILHLVTLQTQIQSNDEFCQKLFSFLKHIIKYSASKNSHF